MDIQNLFELLGTGFFAASGALVTTRQAKPEWAGILFVAFVTATGGGTLCSLLLGTYPLKWVSDPRFLHAVVLGVLAARVLLPVMVELPRTLLVLDTLGIAFFTVIGTEKALQAGVAPSVAVMLGTLSTVLGGVLRDVLTHREPVLFKREIYAAACFAGAGAYVLLDHVGGGRVLTFCTSGFVVVVLRYLAVCHALTLRTFPSADDRQCPGRWIRQRNSAEERQTWLRTTLRLARVAGKGRSALLRRLDSRNMLQA